MRKLIAAFLFVISTERSEWRNFSAQRDKENIS